LAQSIYSTNVLATARYTDFARQTKLFDTFYRQNTHYYQKTIFEKLKGEKMNRKLSLIVKSLIIKSVAVLMIIGTMDSAAFSQTRIRFARGRASATVSGSIAAYGSRSYVLGAQRGQTMTVSVRSNNGDVHVDIGGNDVGTGETIELRSTDDYIITVHNEGGATRYSLYVSIR
jgi:hypothetical protein